MKAFAVVVSLFTVFLCAPVGSAQTAADYFPLRAGSSWLYRITPIGNSTVEPDTTKMVIWGALRIGNRETVLKKNEMRNGDCVYQWFQKDAEGNVVMTALSIEPTIERVIADFDPPMILLSHDAHNAGTSWEIRQKTDIGELFTGAFRVESNRETVTVPAGTFRNCLKIRRTFFDEKGNENGIACLYFAKEVGIVLIEQTKPESMRSREELVEYSVK